MLGDFKIVGTSHVSQESAERVEQEIREWNPDIVALELDGNRLNKLKQERENSEERQNISISAIIRNPFKLAGVKLVQIIQSKFSSQVFSPGEEFWVAYNVSKEESIPVALVDKDINETIKDFSRDTKLFQKIKLFASLISAAILATLGVGSNEISEMVDEDGNIDKERLDLMVEKLNEKYPSIYEHFITNRNKEMARKINMLRNVEKDVLVIVGAAHEEGIRKRLESFEGFEN